MLHADKTRGSLTKLGDRVECHRDRGPARYVIDHPRQLTTVRDLQVVLDQAALGRADIVGRYDQQCVDPRLHSMGGQSLCLCKGLGARCRDHRNASSDGFHRHIDQPIAFRNGQRRWLRRGAIDQDAVGSLLDLEIDQACIAINIDLAVAKRRNQGWD